MRLLLTSAGLYNKSIADGLLKLTNKNPFETKIGFVPTAANVEEGDKSWFFEQIEHLNDYGYKWISVVDVSAPDVDWRSELEKVDVIVVSGGNTFHLLTQVRNSGFDKWMIDNLDAKVYVGMSAGSIIMTPDITVPYVDDGDINYKEITDLNGLSLVDFEISPHTPESVSYKGNENYFADIDNDLYTLDNNSAILVNGKEIDVISEGEWKCYKKKNI